MYGDIGRGITDLLEKLALAVEALELIMHANGSPEDEDYQTSTARDALKKIRGEK